jgi:hypothetical protein
MGATKLSLGFAKSSSSQIRESQVRISTRVAPRQRGHLSELRFGFRELSALEMQQAERMSGKDFVRVHGFGAAARGPEHNDARGAHRARHSRTCLHFLVVSGIMTGS